MKAKASLCIVLGLALVFSFAACNKTSTENGATSGTSTTPDQSTATDNIGSAAPSAPAEKTIDSITIGVSDLLGRFLAGVSPAESESGCNAVFDPIFKPDLRTKGTSSDILESWGWQDDTTFVMKMKENVYFSNGDLATSEDLLFSFLSHPERGSNYLNATGMIFDQCKTTDEFTVELKFERPYVALTKIIWIYLINKAWSQEVGWDSQEWYKPVGSGPYKVSEYVSDSYMVLDARDDYWNKDAGPITVKQWIIRYYPDPATMFMDLELGNIKFCSVQSTDYGRYINDGGAEGYECFLVSRGIVSYFTFGFLNNPIWQDQRLREAIAYCAKWDDLGRVTYEDLFVPANTFVAKDSPLYVEVGTREYNPDKARALLAEAGYDHDNPLVLKTFMMESAVYKNFCEGFQYYANQVGIQCDIQYGDVSSAIAKWIDEETRGIDWGYMYSVSDNPQLDLLTSIMMAGDMHGVTFTYVDDDEFQKVFANIANSINADLQERSSRELQQIIFDKTLMIPVAETQNAFGFRTDTFSEEQLKFYIAGPSNFELGRLGMASAWN